MSDFPVVSTAMLNAAATCQSLTWFGRDDSRLPLPRLRGIDSRQNTFLEWYGENWNRAQLVEFQGGLSNQPRELDGTLPRNVLSVTHFDAMQSDRLGMVTYSDLSGGFGVPVAPTHIKAGGKLYKGVRIATKMVYLNQVPGLNFPLVKVRHDKHFDFWMAMPNQPLSDSADVLSFAADVMSKLRPIFQRVNENWAYVEVPEVGVTVCHESAWLRGLKINEYRLGQVLQVCDLELSERHVRKGSLKPVVASDVASALPPLIFNRDFVVWATHLSAEQLGPVVYVPTSIWQEVG